MSQKCLDGGLCGIGGYCDNCQAQQEAPEANRNPIIIGLQLSATFAPGLNKASDLLRTKYPDATDAELLERLMINGIVVTINRYSKEVKA